MVADLVSRGSKLDDSKRIVVSEEEVLQGEHYCHKAAGPGCVAPRVLKGCAQQLYKFLCRIFNRSLDKCGVPSPWKMSCIIPVQKKRIVTEMKDLRPVPCTSCAMKLFEKVVLAHFQT